VLVRSVGVPEQSGDGVDCTWMDEAGREGTSNGRGQARPGASVRSRGKYWRVMLPHHLINDMSVDELAFARSALTQYFAQMHRSRLNHERTVVGLTGAGRMRVRWSGLAVHAVGAS
jgi:hypothetical protein